MWHTLIDDKDSYVEASATCGFAYGILKGVHMGILDPVFGEHAKKAFDPIFKFTDTEDVYKRQPNILFFLVFFAAPAIVGIWYSLTNFNGLKKMDFIGLENYINLFKDVEFYKVLWNTIKYTIISVPLSYVTALGLGLLLSSEKMKGIGLFRVLIYWPTLLSTIMVGLTWKWIFGESFGLINYLLSKAGLNPIGWSTNATAAFITTIVAGVWAGCGTNMLIFIGALKQDVYKRQGSGCNP